MRFRLGIVVGFAAGYYVGTAAGRERHEQINKLIAKAKRSDAFELASDRARETLDTAAEKAKAAADLGRERARDVVESRTGGNGRERAGGPNGAPAPTGVAGRDIPETDPPMRP